MFDFSELAARRESCRNYVNRQIPPQILRDCIAAARLAPSACNSQPWHFYVIYGNKTARAFAPCVQPLGRNAFAAECSAFAVITEEDASVVCEGAGTVGSQKYAQMDIGMAVENLCLAAAQYDLGSCIIGSFDADAVREFLGLPPEKCVRLVVALGYRADDEIRQKRRKPMEAVADFICDEVK